MLKKENSNAKSGMNFCGLQHETYDNSNNNNNKSLSLKTIEHITENSSRQNFMANFVIVTGHKIDHSAVKMKRSHTSFFKKPSSSLYFLSLGIQFYNSFYSSYSRLYLNG